MADLIIVVAKTDPDAGRARHLADRASRPASATRGFQRGRVLKKIGQHGQDTAELFFDGVRVPAENLLGGAEGQGFIQLMQQLPQERLMLAVGRRHGDRGAPSTDTVDYTKEREAFGRPLFEFQNTRFKLAECATDARVARVFVDDCIVKHLRRRARRRHRLDGQVLDHRPAVRGRRPLPAAASAATATWTSTRSPGCTPTRRVQRIYGGTNEIMKELIARSL